MNPFKDSDPLSSVTNVSFDLCSFSHFKVKNVCFLCTLTDDLHPGVDQDFWKNLSAEEML